ncbi:pyrroloquinoline quinone biosynthesis protein PqqB, partial [Streptomyces sp. NPDC057253]
MLLQVLGTAAGGGVPQWNCACPGCSGARARPHWR